MIELMQNKVLMKIQNAKDEDRKKFRKYQKELDKIQAYKVEYDIAIISDDAKQIILCKYPDLHMNGHLIEDTLMGIANKKQHGSIKGASKWIALHSPRPCSNIFRFK